MNKSTAVERAGNGLDNRKSNLRVCSSSQNNCNKRNSKPKSGYRGVYEDERNGRWVVKLKRNKRSIHIGSYQNKLDAAKAYDEAVDEYHGEYGRKNFPNEKGEG